MTEITTRNAEADWGRFSVSVIPEASLMAITSTPTTTMGQLQRCQHCKKMMKKPYKHRNGKCLEPKYKASSRPKCAYCHQTFSSSKGIPSHLRNSCLVYRQVCEAKGISLPPADHSSSPYDTSSAPSETPEPLRRKCPEPTNSFDQKPKLKQTKPAPNWGHSIVCQYCNKTFLKKAALNRHMQKQCLVWVRKQTASLASLKSIKEVTTGVPLPLPPLPSASSHKDDKSAIVKNQQQQEQPSLEHRAPPVVAEELTKCVYCQQSVGKKTRFLHHNGRCVLGRVNAEHPCPHCPEAFMTRSLLLKHRCDPANKKQRNNAGQTAKIDALPPERRQRRITKITPKQLGLVKAKTPAAKEQITPQKQREMFPLETPTSVVKREFCSHCRQRIRDSDRQKHAEKRCFNNNEVTYNCGYCRKGFATRESMIEHQRSCTVRKQHKQVKCQFCGSMISNRGNLKKHQKVYCKSINRPDEVKSENADKPQKPEKSQKVEKLKSVKSEKPQKLKKIKDEESVKKKPKIKKEKPNHSKVQDEDVENIPLKQRKLHKPKKKKPRFPCEYCKLKFETESLVRKHRQQCTVNRATLTIVCQHCSQRFSKKGNLERHLRLKCKNIDRDKSVLNNTIQELIRPETTDTVNSTPEIDNDEVHEEEPVATDRIEAVPLESRGEPQPESIQSSEPVEPSEPIEPAEPIEPSERRTPEPTEASSPNAEQSVEPPDIPADPSPTSTVDEEVHEVPEPIEEETVVPEEQLATAEEEMEEMEEAELDMTEPEEPVEEQAQVSNESLPNDDHESGNNNAEEREKDSTSEVGQLSIRMESASPMSIERNDDSQQSMEVLPQGEADAEPSPTDAMPENRSEN